MSGSSPKECCNTSYAVALIGAARANLASARRALERERAERPSIADRRPIVGIDRAFAALDSVVHGLGADLAVRALAPQRTGR